MADPRNTNAELSFEAYLRTLGFSKESVSREPGKTHYHGMRKGQETHITFDEGTIPDGTFNTYLSDSKNDSAWLGVISPEKDGRYSFRDKSGRATPSNAVETPLSKQVAEGPQPKAAKAPEASGKYGLHLVRDAKGDNPKLETGRLVLTGPQNEILADFDYKSGPWGKGHAPQLERYQLKQEIEKFTTAGKKPRQLEGLRIDDKSFKGTGRGGILIHPDDSTPGTEGCYGLPEKDWPQFREAWNNIPRDQRPCDMCPMQPDTYHSIKKESDLRKTGALPARDGGALQAALSQYNEFALGSTVPFKPVVPGPRTVG